MTGYKCGPRAVSDSVEKTNDSYLHTVQTPFAACAKINWIAIRPTDIDTLKNAKSGKAWTKRDKTIIFNILSYLKKEEQNDLIKEVLKSSTILVTYHIQLFDFRLNFICQEKKITKL